MKTDTTISELKNGGLIGANDIAVYCMDVPSQWGFFWGGAIGGAIAAANAKNYILSVNEAEIRIFDIDKKTWEYLSTYSRIEMSEVFKFTVKGLGAKTITIKTQNETYRFSTGKKFKRFNQRDELTRLIEFAKTR